jgi:hypothetical protein
VGTLVALLRSLNFLTPGAKQGSLQGWHSQSDSTSEIQQLVIARAISGLRVE